MVYTFKPFIITKELEADLLQLSKDFFARLAVLKVKYSVSEIQIANDFEHGISYNIYSGVDSVSHFQNNHPEF